MHVDLQSSSIPTPIVKKIDFVPCSTIDHVLFNDCYYESLLDDFVYPLCPS